VAVMITGTRATRINTVKRDLNKQVEVLQ